MTIVSPLSPPEQPKESSTPPVAESTSMACWVQEAPVRSQRGIFVTSSANSDKVVATVGSLGLHVPLAFGPRIG